MKNDTEKKEQRINFAIPKEMHKKLKIIGINRNITLSEVIVRAIARAIAEDEKYNK